MLPITLLALVAPVIAFLHDPYCVLLSHELDGDGLGKRQIRTCSGSLVFQTCPDGASCAPPGFFCCGMMGACTVGDICIDGFGCCPAGTPEKLCRQAAELVPGKDYTSLTAMLATRSQNLYYTTSVPPRQVTRTSTRTGTALAVSSSFAWPEKDVSMKGSVISMKGKRSRRIDLENEISVTDDWATAVSCDASKAGLRTNSSVARLQMKLSTEIAGMTIASLSANTDGKLKISYADDTAYLEDQVEVLPLLPSENGTSTGCEVTLKWSRKIEQDGMAQVAEISVSWPITLKRQEGDLWTQINQIVIYADKEALDQGTLGERFDPDTVGESASPSGSSSSLSASTSSLSGSTSTESQPTSAAFKSSAGAASSALSVAASPDTQPAEPISDAGRISGGSVWGLFVSAVLTVAL